MGREFKVFKALKAQLTPNCHLVCFCIIGSKTIKASHIQYPTIFWLHQKINNRKMISLLKKKEFTLKKWDEVGFPPLKIFYRATKKLAFTK